MYILGGYDIAPVMEIAPAFGYISIFISFLALVLLLFMLVNVTPFQIERLRSDHHYRLRFTLTAVSLVNRVSHLATHLMFYCWPAEHLGNSPLSTPTNIPLHSIVNTFDVIYQISEYLQLYLFFAVTIDRYERLEMIVPHSQRAVKFVWANRIAAIITLTCFAGGVSSYIEREVVNNYFDNTLLYSPSFKTWVATVRILESNTTSP